MSIYLKRKENKIKQQDLASYLGVSPSAVSHWEHGDNYPSYEHVKQMSLLFNCSMEEVMLEED